MRLLFNYESRIRLLTGGRVVSNGLFCLTVCSYSVTIPVMNSKDLFCCYQCSVNLSPRLSQEVRTIINHSNTA